VSGTLEASLDELGKSLEGLMAALDDERLDSLESAGRSCAEAFGELRRQLDEAGFAEGELPPELREKMEGVLRMHAVVSSMAMRRKDAAAAEILKVRDARARAQAARPGVATGGSCDVSG
jgi:hypothetical protein